MAERRIELTPAAERALRRVPKRDRPNLEDAFASLARDPSTVAGRPLRGDPKGRLKLRVGDYRIIYRVGPESVVIIIVGHRRDVYKRVRRVRHD